MLQQSTLNFLKSLKKNNNKPWFEKNRSKYEAARQDFSQLVTDVIAAHAKKDSSLSQLQAKDCLFRINRDVRFSKNKTPYKSNMAAYFNGGGKKSPLAGYYFHLSPGQSFVGGGIWVPEPGDLLKIRQEIDYNLDDFKKVLGHKNFKKIYGSLADDGDYKLTRLPKGYEVGNPATEYLKFKSLVAKAPISDSILVSKDLIKTIATAFAALQPLKEFINQAIEG